MTGIGKRGRIYIEKQDTYIIVDVSKLPVCGKWLQLEVVSEKRFQGEESSADKTPLQKSLRGA